MNIEEYEKLLNLWLTRDPKCPCGKPHERKRVGNTLSFEVKHPCAYRGPIKNSSYGKTEQPKKEEPKQ